MEITGFLGMTIQNTKNVLTNFLRLDQVRYIIFKLGNSLSD